MSRTRSWLNWILVSGVVTLAIAPLLLLKNASFIGSDAQAEDAIQEINPGYQPWSAPIFEPASGEIESLLFALQAGLGAGTIGYVVGFYRGKQERSTPQNDRHKNL